MATNLTTQGEQAKRSARVCMKCGRAESGWRYNRCPNCGELAEPSFSAAQGFRELKPMTDKDAASKLRGIFYDLQKRFHDQWEWMDAEFSLMVLEAYLESAYEERDRAQDALRAIRLRVNRQFAVKTIDEYFALKPVSDRQPAAKQGEPL